MSKLRNALLAGAFALGLVITSTAWASPVEAAVIEMDAGMATVVASDQEAMVGELTPDEIAGLTYMREEEKLARDVYTTLYEAWGQRIFSNIARSEQKHMDAVAILLDRYGIADPAAGNDVGQFTDPDLQALYDELVDLGSRSLADALKVGITIEQVDIDDLQQELATVEHQDIQRVYERLEQGSQNHLRAFVSTLQRLTGITYEMP
jgi:hypothetical protein